MFFNELLNNMANNLDSFTDQRVPMCETIHIRANEMGIQENTSHVRSINLIVASRAYTMTAA